MLTLVAAALTLAPGPLGLCRAPTALELVSRAPRQLSRGRSALLCAASTIEMAEGDSTPVESTDSMEGVVAPTTASTTAVEEAEQTSSQRKVNLRMNKARDSETVLKLVTEDVLGCKEDATDCDVFDADQAVNVATALHRLAVMNKRQRAGRDALLRDARFTNLVDAVAEHASDFNARAVADVLWSFATLQHWPPTLLSPVLTSVAVQLEADAFEAQHLSTMTWALAKLECKPVRLLEKIEAQAIPRLGAMNTQNCANLLWGLAKLNYKPAALLPALSDALLAPGALAAAKPVEIADLMFALALTSSKGAHTPLLNALAERAAPWAGPGALEAFTSRQVVILIWTVARLDAAGGLPEGLLDAWVSAVRAAHEATPLLAVDARNLERALGALGVDASWVKQSEMLNVWSDLAAGRSRSAGRSYTDDEVRVAFSAIDTDGSGDIDVAELAAAIRSMAPETDDETVQKMLAYADQDGDGEVSFDEFKKLVNTYGMTN